MDEDKKKRLEALGFKVVTSDDEPVTVVFTSKEVVEAVRQSLATEGKQANSDENEQRTSMS